MFSLRHLATGSAFAILFVSSALADSIILKENFDELSTALGVTAVGDFSAINGTNVDILGGGSLGTFAFRRSRGTASISTVPVVKVRAILSRPLPSL
jgi:hypothetical protein